MSLKINIQKESGTDAVTGSIVVGSGKALTPSGTGIIEATNLLGVIDASQVSTGTLDPARLPLGLGTDTAPANGKILIGNSSGYTAANLTAGTNISISNSAGGITINNTMPSGLIYQGLWNALTNTPTLTSSVGTQGYYYVVNVAGTTNLNGVADWQIGDWAIFNGSIWQKIDNSDQVTSVFGRQGAVASASGDYSASQVTNVPYSGVVATDVQAAINELYDDIQATEQALTAYVTNAESFSITRGQVVYLFGAQGDRASVKLASNLTEATSSKTFGVVADASIAAGQTGYIRCQGVVTNLNLGAYTAGDAVYLGSTPGSFTATEPSAPNHLVYVGIIQRANNGNGLMYVKIQNGYELDEIHDVQITAPKLAGQTLLYDATNALWKNARLTAGTGMTVTNADASVTLTPNFAAPPIIGNTTPNVVNATTLNATSVAATYGTFTGNVTTPYVKADTGVYLTLQGGSTGASLVMGLGSTGQATFDRKLNLTASTTTASSLNIPQGVAPTTPTNGDVWTTSAGVYARINGSTVGPLGVGSITSVTGTSGQVTVSPTTGAVVVSLPTAITNVNSLTATAATDLTLNGGSSGASIVAGQGTNANITLTPSGTGRVSILGTPSAAGSALNGSLDVTDVTAIATGIGGMISFRGYYTGTTATEYGFIRGYKINATDGNYAGGLYFGTRANGSGMAGWMLLNNAGNLLLGTTTDSSNGKLQLATHTTSAGGIGFGTEWSTYRGGAASMVLARNLLTANNNYNFDLVSDSTVTPGIVLRLLTQAGASSSRSFALGVAYTTSGQMDFLASSTSAGLPTTTVGSVNSVGNWNFPATTVSTSTTTGALVVSGGVGVAGAGYFGGAVSMGSWSRTASLLGLNTYGSSAGLNIFRQNLASDPGTLASGDRMFLYVPDATTGLRIGSDGASNLFNISPVGIINIPSTQAASSTTTGALQVAGGLGVAGAIYGNSFYATNIISAGDGVTLSGILGANSSSNVSNLFLSRSDYSWGMNNEGDLRFYLNTSRTTAPSTGGVNLMQLLAGSGTLATAGLNISSTKSASSSIAGALTVGNGTAATNVAIGGGKINAGDGITAGGSGVVTSGTFSTSFNGSGFANPGWLLYQGYGVSLYFRDTVNGVMAVRLDPGTLSTGSANVLYQTPSTSTTTGALVVSGGMGVAGAGYFGGNLTFGTSGSILNGTTGSIGLTATGTNQNITLTPSGSGLVSIVSSAGNQSSILRLSVPATATLNSILSYYLSGLIEWQSGALNSDSSYRISSSGIGTTDAFVIKSSQNVLLGTPTDSSNGRLQLATHTTSAGGIGFGTDTSLYRATDGHLWINTATGNNPSLKLSIAGTQYAWLEYYSPDSAAYLTSAAGKSLVFRTNGGTNALTLDTSQNATFANGIVAGKANSVNTIKGGDSGAGTSILQLLNSGNTVQVNVRGDGRMELSNTTASTSTTTGALVVSGGVGVAGGIYAGAASVFGSTLKVGFDRGISTAQELLGLYADHANNIEKSIVWRDGTQVLGGISVKYLTSGNKTQMLLGSLYNAGAPTSTPVLTLDGTGAATFAGTISPQQAATASAPTYVKGAIYFDTTLNKLRVGGATAWETITSI